MWAAETQAGWPLRSQVVLPFLRICRFASKQLPRGEAGCVMPDCFVNYSCLVFPRNQQFMRCCENIVSSIKKIWQLLMPCLPAVSDGEWYHAQCRRCDLKVLRTLCDFCCCSAYFSESVLLVTLRIPWMSDSIIYVTSDSGALGLDYHFLVMINSIVIGKASIARGSSGWVYTLLQVLLFFYYCIAINKTNSIFYDAVSM